METLVITIRDEKDRQQVEEALRDVEGLTSLRVIDEVTQLAEPALAESWASEEDQRWDSLLWYQRRPISRKTSFFIDTSLPLTSACPI